MSASVVYPQRVAMISMHTSPLATPGVGEVGGRNVELGDVGPRRRPPGHPRSCTGAA